MLNWLLIGDPARDIEAFLLSGICGSPSLNLKYHGIELVHSIVHSDSQQASCVETFLEAVCKLLRVKWRSLSIGSFYSNEYVEIYKNLDRSSEGFGSSQANSKSIDSYETAFEQMVRFLCCRYDDNFVIITSLPLGFSQLAQPSLLNSPTAPSFSPSSRQGSMDLGSPTGMAKSRKTAKQDISFKTALHATLRKIKGISSLSVAQP